MTRDADFVFEESHHFSLKKQMSIPLPFYVLEILWGETSLHRDDAAKWNVRDRGFEVAIHLWRRDRGKA